jgi:hypothetical protein
MTTSRSPVASCRVCVSFALGEFLDFFLSLLFPFFGGGGDWRDAWEPAFHPLSCSSTGLQSPWIPTRPHTVEIHTA